MISDPDPLLRHLGPEAVLAALGAARRGVVYDLGTDLGNTMPTPPPDTFAGFRLSPYRTPAALTNPAFRGHDFSMEVVSGSPHIGSHIDALTHIQSEGRIYGGHAAAATYSDFGWRINGAECIPPIVTRGLFLDMPRDLGLGEHLPDGFEIRVEHVEAALAKRGCAVRQGDTVLVRTGKFAADYVTNTGSFYGPQPGVGPDAAIWLYERGMAVLGTDTSATEAFPFPDPERTTHRAMLVERGVHLVEILDLEALAAAGESSFLFVCLPLRIRGGTGSWVRPIAIV